MSAIATQPSAVPAPRVAPPIRTLAELQASLGNVPLHRILVEPSPGKATVHDVIRLVEGDKKRLVELVNGTLVEKPMGLRESVIAGRVIRRLANIVEPNNLGFVSGEAGMIRMLMGNVRMPDVAFFRPEDVPGGQLPRSSTPFAAGAGGGGTQREQHRRRNADQGRRVFPERRSCRVDT